MVGRYTLDPRPELALTFSREDEVLYAEVAGQGRRTLKPVGELSFAIAGVEAQITFRRNEQGAVDGLIFSQGGRDMPATRKGGLLPSTFPALAPMACALSGCNSDGRYM